MFQYPEAYHSYSAVWLTGFIGHVWLMIFPVKGMLGLNILFVLLLQLNALVFFIVLRKQYKHFILLPAIGIAMLLGIPMMQSGFGYQSLTVVILNFSALLLFKGATENKNGFVFAAGFLSGLSIFARLPNILSFAFMILLIIHHFSAGEKKDKAVLWRQIISFNFGFILSVSCISLLIYVYGYADNFKAGIHELSIRTQDSGSAYSSEAMLSLYFSDALKSILAGLKYLLLLSFLIYTIPFLQAAYSSVFKKLHWLLIIVGAVAAYCSWYSDINYILKYHIKYVLPFLSALTGLILLLLNSKRGTNRVLLYLLAVLIYIISFAGTNTGITPYGLLFLILFTIAELLSFTSENIFAKYFIKSLSLFILCLLIPLALIINYKFIYRDDNNRAELHYPVSNGLLNGLYTSKRRAIVVNELLSAISVRIHPGEELWATPNLPLLYPVTGTKPYLLHPWENLLPVEEISSIIQRREREDVKLPVIVIAKGSTRNNDWPQKIIPDKEDKSQLVKDFIIRHHYTLTWQNGFFEVWTR